MLHTNVFPQVVSIAYSLLIIIAFFSKKKVRTVENNIFKLLIVGNFVGLIIDVIGYFVVKYLGSTHIITILVCRLILIYLLLWIFTMTAYIYAIANNVSYNDQQQNNDKWRLYAKVKKIIIIFEYILCSLAVVLPIEIIGTKSGDYYSTGYATYIVYAISFLLIISWVVIILKNRGNIRNKKFYPMYAYMALGAVTTTIQFNYPQMLLIIPVETFVTVLMYFTIENPDIKMLNELYKNRELMEQGYEDKYNFLFEMTQEAKKPLLDLNRISGELRNTEDPKVIKDGLSIVNTLTRQLDFSINNVLNISSFDIQKLKIVNTRYDVVKVCEGLEATARGEIKPEVTLNFEIPKQVPLLYGDYMKLRQILYSLLNNASKNTENGSITLRLNIIEKYDFCRLIFNISDTGKGMSIDKINEILSATGELDKNELEILEKKEFNFKVCQKVVKIMGGNLMIKSAEGAGTDITLTLDQRVYREKEDSVLNQYENAIKMIKKVLIVAQDKDLSTFIKNRLNANSITYSALAYGGDAVDRLKAGKSYDYILIEDEMKEMSGLATLQEMQKLNNFKIPTIIMLHEDKERIAKAYISDGFSDYLVIDRLDEELKRIIDKY